MLAAQSEGPVTCQFDMTRFRAAYWLRGCFRRRTGRAKPCRKEFGSARRRSRNRRDQERQLRGAHDLPRRLRVTYKEVRPAPRCAADRARLRLQGLDVIQAYDGHGGWRINPFQGRKDAEKMSADEARSIADEALVEGPLLAARTDGSQAHYLGREDFDGTLAYKLKVTQKDGDEFIYLLDPDTYLEIKVDETRRIRGAQQTTETELGDYEKIAGVYFPMSVESWQQGSAQPAPAGLIATGTANPPVAPAIFAEPGGPRPTCQGARSAARRLDRSRKASPTANKPTEGATASPSQPAKGSK